MLFLASFLHSTITIITRKKSEKENFEIVVSQGAGQVHARYIKDEDVIEIVFTFPPTYPLKPIEPVIPKRVGFNEAQWRMSQMALVSLLRNQDATILDACLLWKEIIEKRLNGVELCPICYSLFQGTSIPNLACPQCPNKFHSVCIKRWFQESQKTVCPLCQCDFSLHR